MFGQLAQPFHIPLDQFRSAVVVAQQGEDAVLNRAIDLPATDVDAEEDVDDREDEVVEDVLESWADSLSVVEVDAGGAIAAGLLLQRLLFGEIWFEHGLAFGGGDDVAMLVFTSA